MKDTQVSHDGGKNWEQAKEEPYYNMGIEWLKCLLGFHEWAISKRYRGTLTCFRCGKRKTGQSHY